MKERKAIIVDIDGTIATHYDPSGRQIREHHDYSQVDKDLPVPEIIELVKMYDDCLLYTSPSPRD